MKKKEKAPKAPKAKKAPKGSKAPKKIKKMEQDPASEASAEKKGIPKILFIILPLILVLAVAGVVVYLLFFRTPSEEDQINKNPGVYVLGADEVVSLEGVVEEGMVTRTSVEAPTEDGPQVWIYHYRQVGETPSKLAAAYAEVLQGEELGFVVTDRDNHLVEEEPDMDSAIGSVILARASVDTGEEEDGKEGDGKEGEDGGESVVDKLLQVVLAWSEGSVAIQVSQPEGTILPPVVEEDPATKPVEPVALMAQLEYFNKLPAAKLGLPGDTLSEYRVYPVDGFVRVSGVTCRVLNVYVTDLPAETNTFMGTYYLSSDNSQLFKLDEATNTIVSVSLD